MTLAEAQTRLAAVNAAYDRALTAASYSVPGFSVARQSLEALARERAILEREVARLTDAAAGYESSGYGFATFD